MEYDITIKQEDGSLKEYPIYIDAVTSPNTSGNTKQVISLRENAGKLEYSLDGTTWKPVV